MHHDLAWRLDLLKTIERHIIKVTCTIQVSLLVAHNLLEEMIAARFTLLLLQQQVVCRCNLVMLIILNVSYGLAQVAIRINT